LLTTVVFNGVTFSLGATVFTDPILTITDLFTPTIQTGVTAFPDVILTTTQMFTPGFVITGTAIVGPILTTTAIPPVTATAIDEGTATPATILTVTTFPPIGVVGLQLIWSKVYIGYQRRRGVYTGRSNRPYTSGQ
jgi:hypothetical protein